MRNTHTHSMSLSPAFFTLSCPYFLLLIPLSLHPYPSRIHRPPPLPFLFLTPLAYSPSSSLLNSPFFIIALPPSQQLSRLLYIRISFVSCLPGSHEWYSLIHITHTKAYTHTPRTHNESHAHTHAKYTAHVHGYTPRTSRHRGEENQIFKSDD